MEGDIAEELRAAFEARFGAAFSEEPPREAERLHARAREGFYSSPEPLQRR